MTDARSVDIYEKPLNVADAEWESRIQLAACHRLMAKYRMTDLANGFIGARVKNEGRDFLLAPYGMFDEEVRASDLVQLALDDTAVVGRGTELNAAAVNMCKAIFKAREDVGCILHAHTRASMIISTLECGLLPLCQAGFMLHDSVAYSDFEFTPDDTFCTQLLRDLGDKKVMLLHHHGMLIAARDVPEAFFLAFYLNQACDVQLGALQTGQKLRLPGSANVERWCHDYQTNPFFEYDGTREWPALIRVLDRDSPTYRS